MSPTQKYRVAVLGDDPWVSLGAKALREMGHEVKFIPIHGQSRLSEIEPELEVCRPHFCFGRGIIPFQAEILCGAELETHLEKKGIPYAGWYLDNPESTGDMRLFYRWERGPYPKGAIIFCADRQHIPFFTSKGMKAYHLSHCVEANLESFVADPKVAAHYRGPLNFVGTPPNAVEPLECGTEDQARRLFLNGYLRTCADFWKELLNQGSVEESNARKQGILQSIEAFFDQWHDDADAYAKAKRDMEAVFTRFLPVTEVRLGLKYIDFVYSSYQLVASLLRLKEKGIRIYGGEPWKHFFHDYQSSYERIPFDEVSSFYAAGDINFCLTKWQYYGAVHDRPLMIFASGGFALTDYRKELEETFEPGEIHAYRSFEEAKELIDYYQTHSTQRLEMIQKARNRVFKEHTYHHRMQTLLYCLKEAGVLMA